MSDDAWATVERTRVTDGVATPEPDSLVREEPLEIRIGGVPIAVVMRSPGHDLELARGFVLTERVVDDPTHVASIRHCTTVEEPEAEDNVVQVTLAPDVRVDLARLRRNMYASSSCGICGKATLDIALAHAPALPADDLRIDSAVLYSLPDKLRDDQDVFQRTGGLHAAGLFDVHGSVVAVREDVGRHNAVDKIVGFAVDTDRFPLSRSVLMVSGRVSYEIVQKALVARVPVLAAVSAPSSLAVELAQRAGITLVAFLRGRSMSVYSGPHRVG